MDYKRFIEPSTLAEQQHLAGLEVTEARAGVKFQKKKITLNLPKGQVPVDAEVVGSWAIHLDPNVKGDEERQPGFVVTFIPTSQRLAWKRSKTSAKKVVTLALKAVPELRDAKTIKEIEPHVQAINKAIAGAGA